MFFGCTHEYCKFGCQKMAAVKSIYSYFSLTENPVKPPDCMKALFISDCRLDNFSHTPGAWKGTDLRSCSVRWDWAQVSALWFTLPSAQDIPTGCCLCPGAGLQSWCHVTPERRDLSCCRRPLHPATLLPRLWKISPSPIPVLIPSIFYEFFTSLSFFTPEALGIYHSSKGVYLPHLSNICTSRVSPYSSV